MVQLFYTTYISVDLSHHEIFCAKFGNGGISSSKMGSSWRETRLLCANNNGADKLWLPHSLIRASVCTGLKST